MERRMPDPHQIYGLTAAVLFAISAYGLFLCRHFVKKIIAAKILGAAVFLLLVSLAKRDAEAFADPVPHAMVITGIVVAVSMGAFALALARRIHRLSGRCSFAREEDEA